jgi:hypothetical protein
MWSTAVLVPNRFVSPLKATAGTCIRRERTGAAWVEGGRKLPAIGCQRVISGRRNTTPEMFSIPQDGHENADFQA